MIANEKATKAILKMLPHISNKDTPSERDYKYVKKKLFNKKVDFNDSEFLLSLVNQKYDEQKVKNLIKAAYDLDYFVDDTKKDSHVYNSVLKENIVQLAIQTGYSKDFIIYLLKTYGNKDSKILDVNCRGRFIGNILETAHKNNYSYKDIIEIYHTLNTETNYRERASHDDLKIMLKEIEKTIPVTEYEHEGAAILLAYLYNRHFDLLMEKMTDDNEYNKKLLESELMLTCNDNRLVRKYNLCRSNELLLMCLSKKYDDEELVFKTVERILKTGLTMVSDYEPNLFVAKLSYHDHLGSLAIRAGYSEKFIEKLIKLLSLNGDIECYLFDYLETSIFESDQIVDVKDFYNFLREMGLNLLDKRSLFTDKRYEEMRVNDLYKKKYGIYDLIIECALVEFIREIDYLLHLYELKLSIRDIDEYRNIYTEYYNLKTYLKMQTIYSENIEDEELVFILIKEIIRNRNEVVGYLDNTVAPIEIYNALSALNDFVNSDNINHLKEENAEELKILRIKDIWSKPLYKGWK